MTHTEALEKALSDSFEYCNSIYGYHPRRIKNVLKEARAEKDHTTWTYENKGDEAIIEAANKSEYHRCW